MSDQAASTQVIAPVRYAVTVPLQRRNRGLTPCTG